MFLSEIKDHSAQIQEFVKFNVLFHSAILDFFSAEAELREIKNANHQIGAQNEIQILFATEFQIYHPHRIASDLN